MSEYHNKLKENWYNSITFSADGMYGLGQLGVLLKISEITDYNKFKNNICEINGSSIGALVGTLFSSDKSIKEIINMTKEIDYDKIIQPDIKNFLSLGIDSGWIIINIINKLLKDLFNNENITFENHYKITKKKLTISVYNLTNERIEYINKDNNGDLKLSDAIRMSISIPILFTPILVNNFYYIDPVIHECFFINDSKQNLVIKGEAGVMQNNYNKLGLHEYCIKIILSLLKQNNNNLTNKYKYNDNVDIINYKLLHTENGVFDIYKVLYIGYTTSFLGEERS